MTGKNHVITNTCSVVCAGSGIGWLHKVATNISNFTTKPSFLQSVIIGFDNTIQQFLSTTFLHTNGTNSILFGILSISAFCIGTLFPDIDNENSMLGKFFHLPIEHRTWTHAIWFPIFFGLLALIEPILWWLVLGYMGHLVWDNASRGGVCFFYPISKYRHFGNSGAKIKNGHFVYLYRTGKTSEGVVVGVVATISVIILILDLTFGLFWN